MKRSILPGLETAFDTEEFLISAGVWSERKWRKPWKPLPPSEGLTPRRKADVYMKMSWIISERRQWETDAGRQR